MTEVGIPVYHARATLPKALDSLLCQTKEMFITCISIDGDGEDYSDIIETYRERGLKIRVIHSDINGGPGAARQRILDTTQCEYIMFLDADDMLMPRAVDILTRTIRTSNLDILRSSFIREEASKNDRYIAQDVGTITWFHGKIYRVKYLKDIGVHFISDLRTDEDAHFNLVAWNATEARGELSEVTYLWRNNSNSITRAKDELTYFRNTYHYYILSQIEGLKDLYHARGGSIQDKLVATTLINIYYYYMEAKFLKEPLIDIEAIIGSLSQEPWLKEFFNKAENWMQIITTIKSGFIFANERVVFFKEPFNEWAGRLFKFNE